MSTKVVNGIHVVNLSPDSPVVTTEDVGKVDVNVLVAMSWPRHGHAVAQKRIAQHGVKGWATCPITEAGFVQIISRHFHLTL